MGMQPAEMSPYEARVWTELEGYWRNNKGAGRRRPAKVQSAIDSVTKQAGSAAHRTRQAVSDHAPQRLKDAGGAALDTTLEPAIRAVLHLLEWVTEQVEERMKPDPVVDYHRSRGLPVESLADLYSIDLELLDCYTRRTSRQWRTTGVVEGSAMGALAFVPGPGTLVAVSGDLLVMHALATAVCSQVAFAYGIDVSSDSEREHLRRMVTRSWGAQLGKSKTVKSAGDAFQAGRKRVRWSDKLRHDHRIAAALEELLKKAYGVEHVPVGKVMKRLPLIGIVTSAGINSHVLASLAKSSIRYSQTVYLCRKYNLPLPPGMAVDEPH